MSAHTARPGTRRRHPARPATLATTAAIALLAAACTSTASTTGPDTAASVVAAASAGGQAPTLTGAGSTFDAPFFAAAFARYQKQHPAVVISYSAVGSSAGIAAFSARRVDFGASDVPMTAAEQAAATGGPIAQVPVALGGEGIVYNLSLPAGARLHLTGPVLAAIYLGQVTSWHDPAITALNPSLPLPATAIRVVHRSDGSGTTYIFSNYLTATDPAWAAKVGTGKTLHWPTGEGAQGNGGVASAVYRTRSPSDTWSTPTPRACSCRTPRSATRPATTSSRPPRPSPPTPPRNPASPRPTSPSSTSPDPRATPLPATAGR
jgi:phosphate transport system substrate-binding protein